jgi:hypothetical protein
MQRDEAEGLTMVQRRTRPAALLVAVNVVLVVLVVLLAAHGWVDGLIAALAVLMLAASYRLKRQARSRLYERCSTQGKLRLRPAGAARVGRVPASNQ